MINGTSDLQRRAEARARGSIWAEAVPLAILGVLCGFLFFYGLASFGLVGADEPRYAQIAREMLERHDWVTPVLYGKAWLEKPILYYWQAMLSYSIFGVSDWAARLPVACDALLMIVAIYFFVRRFRPGLQLDAALIAASMGAIIGFGRAASTDMPLASMLTIAMLAWLAFYLTDHKRWLAAFYIFLGLAMLAKGPVSLFLAGLVIIPFAAIRRDLRIVFWRTFWWPGILLFVAVALPWYVAVQVRAPEFFRVFVLEHNLARYGSNLYRHHQPFWYYVPVWLLSVLPWTVLSLTALVSAIRQQFRRDEQGRAEEKQGLGLFFVLWAALPIAFFSFSGSKLPGYILPAIPAFALLLVEWLHRKRSIGQRATPALIVGHAALATLVLTASLLSPYIVYRLRPTARAYEIAGAFSLLILLAMAAMLFIRGLRVLHFVTLIPVVLGLAFVVKVAAPVLDTVQSARPVAREIQNASGGSVRIAGFGIRRELEYGLAFYLNRPVSMYDRAEIPPSTHIVVARKGSEVGLAALLPGRRITRLLAYEPQGVEIYSVESTGTTH